MKLNHTVEPANAQIIPFPIPESEPKSEITYTETFKAACDTLDALEAFYQKGQHYSPAEIYKLVVEIHLEKKYGEVQR